MYMVSLLLCWADAGVPSALGPHDQVSTGAWGVLIKAYWHPALSKQSEGVASSGVQRAH